MPAQVDNLTLAVAIERPNIFAAPASTTGSDRTPLGANPVGRAAMGQAARLAIIELLLPERMTPSGPMLSSALLDQALRRVSTTPLAAGPHILEAVAV